MRCSERAMAIEVFYSNPRILRHGSSLSLFRQAESCLHFRGLRPECCREFEDGHIKQMKRAASVQSGLRSGFKHWVWTRFVPQEAGSAGTALRIHARLSAEKPFFERLNLVQ